jgi:competence protein ComEC
MSRRKAIIGIFIGIWVYALAVGFDPPIIRAAIMGSIAFAAQGLGRLGNAFQALVLSAAIMLLFNPLWIRDIGFQLSFMATLSLIVFNTKVDRLISFVPNILRQDLATSLAAQIGVAPLLLIYFGSVSIFSPFINALLLWTIPPVTIVGMLAGVMGVVFPLLGKMLLMLIYPLTSWFLFVVTIFS